jgi:hypothetical protein
MAMTATTPSRQRGKSFLDGRLHVVLSGEYSHEDGIPAGGFGEAAANGRTWYNTDTLINRGINPGDGGPQYLYRQHVQSYQYTKYGLITAGPLQGIAFDKNGNPFNFNYGSNGVPARNAAGNVSNCYGGFCVGGDLSGNVGIGTSLQSEITRWDGYGRIGFDIDSNNEIYGTLNVSRVASNNTPNPGAAKTGLTMQCSNPFVPASVQAMCTTAASPASAMVSAMRCCPTSSTSIRCAARSAAWSAPRASWMCWAPTGPMTAITSMVRTSPTSTSAT